MKDNKIFDGNLGTYSPIRTDDGSWTYHSGYFDEACHSKDGAVQETIYNFIEGTVLEKKLKNNALTTIFEVGLGVGIGVDCSFEIAKKLNKELCFITTEIDRGLIEFNIKQRANSPLWKNLKYHQEENYFQSKVENIKFIILNGDASKNISEKIANLKIEKFNCIFQDAFSPRKNPDLWTKDWFKALKSLSHEDCIMSTYSSHPDIRQNMKDAGWFVYKRKGFGNKKNSTVAKINKDPDMPIV